MTVYWEAVAGIGLGVALGNLLTLCGLFGWALLAAWIASVQKGKRRG